VKSLSSPIAFGLAGVLLLQPLTAFAENGPYLAVRGGLVQAQTASFDVGTSSAVVDGNQEHYRIGYAADLAGGYQLGPLRVEAEASQKRTRLSSFYALSTASVPNSATAPKSRAGGTFAAPTGKSRIRSLMVNAIVSTTNRDVFADGNVHFFAGGGVGYAWARAFNHRAVAGADTYLNGGARSFAW